MTFFIFALLFLGFSSFMESSLNSSFFVESITLFFLSPEDLDLFYDAESETATLGS